MTSAGKSREGISPSGGYVSYRLVRRLLIAVGIFNAVSAVGGGIGLLIPGSLGIPLSLIAGSGFTSYFWPGILLILVIGGSQCAAVISELRTAGTAAFWTSFAGFAMIIWIFVEMAVMGGYSVLHGIYFAAGVAQLALLLALLGVVPGLVSGGAGTGSGRK